MLLIFHFLSNSSFLFLQSRYRRWLKRPPSHASMRATGASAVATTELGDAL
jgi:hypothetical protein